VAKRSRSGLKRKRQAESRRVANQAMASRVKTLAKQATTPDTLQDAISALDRAAAAGIIHKNTAARKKSRLVKRLRSGAGAV